MSFMGHQSFPRAGPAVLDTVLRQKLATKSLDLPGGSFLYRQGDPCNGLYILERGSVELQLESEHGTCSLGSLCAPGIVGLAECLSGAKRCHSVKTLQDASIQVASTEDTVQLLRQDALACLAAVSFLSEETTSGLRLLRQFQAFRCKPHAKGN